MTRSPLKPGFRGHVTDLAAAWAFAWLGAGFAGTEGTSEAGFQSFDEGVVAEGAAGALVAAETRRSVSCPRNSPGTPEIGIVFPELPESVEVRSPEAAKRGSGRLPGRVARAFKRRKCQSV